MLDPLVPAEVSAACSGVVDSGTDVPIVAPEHFLDHAVSENVHAGPAMICRTS